MDVPSRPRPPAASARISSTRCAELNGTAAAAAASLGFVVGQLVAWGAQKKFDQAELTPPTAAERVEFFRQSCGRPPTRARKGASTTARSRANRGRLRR